MPAKDKISWVPLLAPDLTEVDRIAIQIHPMLPERPEVFAEKVRLFPQGCFKLMFEDRIAGYGISHPWKLFSTPPLDDFLKALPERPDCIYMHDIAVLPEARGHNAAGQYVAKISAVAREMGIRHLSCVSVYGTDILWARFGFRVVVNNAVAAQLADYGPSARYMIADILRP